MIFHVQPLNPHGAPQNVSQCPGCFEWVAQSWKSQSGDLAIEGRCVLVKSFCCWKKHVILQMNYVHNDSNDWLVVSNMAWVFSIIYGMSSFPLTLTNIFKMVIAPPTRWWLVYILRFSEDFVKFYQVAVCQNLVPLVNIKIAGKWMFIPLKMVLILIGIDPYPSLYFCWTHISIGEIGEVSGNPCCGTSSAAGAELVGAQGEGRAALGRGKWH